MGRPTKLTEDLLEELCQHLEDGNAIATACDLVGISERVYHKWQARGKEEVERVAEDGRRRVRKDERRYVQFVQATTRARAAAVQKRVSNIRDAASEDWRASAWLLERMKPEEWGKTQKHEHMGEGGGPLRVTGINFAAEEGGDE